MKKLLLLSISAAFLVLTNPVYAASTTLPVRIKIIQCGIGFEEVKKACDGGKVACCRILNMMNSKDLLESNKEVREFGSIDNPNGYNQEVRIIHFL